MSNPSRVFVHVVTHNHESSISECLKSILAQEDFIAGENLQILVSDNNSSDATPRILRDISAKGLDVVCYQENFGFCLMHNFGIQKFMDSDFDFYLCLNPDLLLAPRMVTEMTSACANSPERIGTVCPKLLRLGDDLMPADPPVIDAAGMCITHSLRHFDRGSGEADNSAFDRSGYVFGGSGACLLMSREFIQDAVIAQPEFDGALAEVYPQYRNAPSPRAQLFDEAFFAYREDADLAWRSQSLGWKCLYQPSALGYHIRRVTPDRRASLPAEINLLGVKNRFLLQLNNYSIEYGIKAFLLGYLFRNLVVLLALFLKERSSLPAIGHLMKLLPRALKRRALIRSRTVRKPCEISRWFNEEIQVDQPV